MNPRSRRLPWSVLLPPRAGWPHGPIRNRVTRPISAPTTAHGCSCWMVRPTGLPAQRALGGAPVSRHRTDAADERLAWLGDQDARGEAPRTHATQLLADGGYARLGTSGAWALLRLPRFRFRPPAMPTRCTSICGSTARTACATAARSRTNAEDHWLRYISAAMASHNTVQFDGRDQMPRLSRFLFGDWLVAEELTLDEASTTVSAALPRQGRAPSAPRPARTGAMRGRRRGGWPRDKAVLRWRIAPTRAAGAAPTGSGATHALESRSACRRRSPGSNASRAGNRATTTRRLSLPVLEVEIGADATPTTEITHPHEGPLLPSALSTPKGSAGIRSYDGPAPRWPAAIRSRWRAAAMVSARPARQPSSRKVCAAAVSTASTWSSSNWRYSNRDGFVKRALTFPRLPRHCSTGRADRTARRDFATSTPLTAGIPVSRRAGCAAAVCLRGARPLAGVAARDGRSATRWCCGRWRAGVASPLPARWSGPVARHRRGHQWRGIPPSASRWYPTAG